METVVRSASALLLEVSLKSAALLLAAAIVTRGLRRASAASRHFVWLLALVGLLGLPFLSAALPGWNPPLLAGPLASSPLTFTTGPRTAADRSPRATGPSSPAAAISAAVGESTPGNVPSPWPLRVLLTWLAGFVLVLARMVGGLRVVARLTRSASLDGDASLMAAAAEARAALGIRRHISIRLGISPSHIAVPMTTGFRRPTLLLPRDAGSWPAERLRMVLLHEMAHVRRDDWLAQLLANLACALHWFNPLAWWARRRLRSEAEQASDDLVLATGVKPSEYAFQLWEIVRGLSALHGLSGTAVALARRREIQDRLQAIVAASTSRAALSRRAAISSALGALCFLVSVAALHPARMGPDGSRSGAGEAASNVVATVPGYAYTFAEGLRLELIAVAEPRADGGRSWRPNGVLLTRQPVLPEVSGARKGLATWKRADHPLAFCFRLTSETTDVTGDFVAYLIPPVAGTAPDAHDTFEGHLTALPPGGRSDITYLHAFRQRPATCGFRFGAALGPWQTVATLSYAPDRSAVGASGDIAFLIGEHPRLVSLDAAKKEQRRVIPLDRPVFGDVARRLVLVDRNGDTSSPDWHWHAATIDGERALVVAGEALKGIKEIRLQTRPYQWLEFRDVALRASDRKPARATPVPVEGPVRPRGSR